MDSPFTDDSKPEPLRVPHWDELPPNARERWQAILKLIDLPPLVFETMAINLQGEAAEPKFLARRIGTDPLLAAKVLAVANSAAAGQIKEVASLERAIIQLGLNMLHYLVLAYYLETIVKARLGFSRDHMEYVQRWGAIAAVLAGKIAADAQLAEVPVITTAALLSRLGGLVLGLEEPRAGADYWRQPNEVLRLIYEFERWGITCNIISARLILNWGLPESLQQYSSGGPDPLFWGSSPPAGAAARAQAAIAAGIVLGGANLLNPQTKAPEILGRQAYTQFTAALRSLKLYDSAVKVYSQTTVQRELELIRR